MKLYILFEEKPIKRLSQGVLYSFASLRGVEIPACLNLPSGIEFLNIPCTKRCPDYEGEVFLRRTFFRALSRQTSWLVRVEYPCRRLSRNEFNSEKLIYLTLFLGKFRYIFDFYASFFFLFFFGKAGLSVDIRSRILIHPSYSLYLDLWQVLPSPLVLFCMARDYERGFLELKPDKRTLVNNALGYLLGYRGAMEIIKEAIPPHLPLLKAQRCLA